MPDAIWVGIYNIGDNSFTVWRSPERDELASGMIRFTPREEAAISDASFGRSLFVWNPFDSELSNGSRADWARM